MSSEEQSFNTSTTSPARMARIQEKEELAHLNDRLMSYIEQVRSMKDNNVRLELELETIKDTAGKELDNMKGMYDTELADARNLIDETAKEKARQQILAQKYQQRVEELEAELKELKAENDRLEGRATAAERKAASLEAERKSALAEKTKLQKTVKDQEAELEELRGLLANLKAQLDSETLSKVQLQNGMQTLREDLAFKKKLYDEELQALREKQSTLQTTSYIEQTDFQAQLDSRLEEAIDELRERSDKEVEEYRSSVERAYKDKVDALEKQASRDAASIAKLNSELRKTSSTLSQSQNSVSQFQKEIENLESKLRDKEQELARARQLHGEEVGRLSDELRSLRENYEAKIQEYEELVDIKVKLDQELATYRALLQEEETRLNLTATPRDKPKRTRKTTTTTAERPSKKARYETTTSAVSTSASGCFHITKVDPDGSFVKIKNMSNEIESLGGFKIVHEVDGCDEVAFKFHSKSKLQGQTSVTVWGSDAENATHNPPTDIVWRSQGSWGTGVNVVTKLVNKAGEVMAQYSQQSETSPVKSAQEEFSASFQSIDQGAVSFPHLPEDIEKDSPSKPVTRSDTRKQAQMQQLKQQKVGQEHMFHQKGDPRAVDKAPCVIS